MTLNTNNLYTFYCLSYKNEERKTVLIERFNKLNINITFYDGVEFDDMRIRIPAQTYAVNKKSWSYTYGHFDMIDKFVI